jgi:phosphoribosylformylglycinamidine cyclo-ligase
LGSRAPSFLDLTVEADMVSCASLQQNFRLAQRTINVKSKSKMKYSEVGVSYADMDPWKILCQTSASSTRGILAKHSLSEVRWSRGESVYLIEARDCFYGHVEEGLGTKNLVADEMYQLTGKSYYDAIAQDLVAAIVNDLVTLGVSPVCIAPHMAAGSSVWFSDKVRNHDFVRGFKKACKLTGAVWGPGESPTLVGIVERNTIELSGSCFGIIRPKSRLIVPKVRNGDRILLIGSSGIHANGLTLARAIADKLPKRFLTTIDKRGTTFGSALLQPSLIYSSLVEKMLNTGVSVNYAIHITGHGWRKLMRLPKPFAYVMDYVPPVPRLFEFMQERGPVSDEEAYGNFNMGVGFAFILPANQSDKALRLARRAGFNAWIGGTVQASSKASVEIVPKNISFKQDTLALR